MVNIRSNNTNKLSPQEPIQDMTLLCKGSNNTNKLSPQEQGSESVEQIIGSNNTNKLSPQELHMVYFTTVSVQIIQINLVLKNYGIVPRFVPPVQIIQINLVLKNEKIRSYAFRRFK